jgi:hypothetical protein
MKRLKIRIIESSGVYWYIAYTSDAPAWKYILFPVREGSPALARSSALKAVL